ncbi:SusC/RagA family TonB-linked outer membrane protein [Empedobacter brevis NBRC 14943 = ATCC 43319]|uniref:SusC/RagA family TonB-linked outer membrane protein n=2 Tax=Empedobacter brevis TaxID=247 RepID=A0A511NKG9_9FLAO|nr:SusC/RagA family TonB-linked outer membrane protein [Empedobacter brevis NBRC 14943 = ATCC 43319]
MQTQAYNLYGQQNKITLELQNQTVKHLIDRVENETDYKFVYMIKDVDVNRIINIKMKNGTIEKLLQKTFENTPIRYQIKGKQILLMLKKEKETTTLLSEKKTPVLFTTTTAKDNQESITGTVSDSIGPIADVLVSVKATGVYVITDENGNYAIEASPGDILVFSNPGYDTLEIPVGNKTVVNARMQQNITDLKEVIVNAGYYKVKEQERTGSISKITAEEIGNQPVNSPLDALIGRMTGVDIIPNSGLAGSGFQVRVRGQNSIAAGNEPLYIVDGVPYDAGSMGDRSVSGTVFYLNNISPLNTLDPSTIASIEVLKDADATAIYGSRGANGVVLITTKNGKPGKTVFSVDASTTLISATRFLKLLNTEQYLQMRREAFINDGITEYPSNAYDINGTWDQNRYTDWQKEFMGNIAYNNTIRASASGGNEQTLFSIGGSFMKETTVFPGDFNYKRTTAFANISHQSKNNRFTLQFSANYGLDRNFLPATDLSRRARILPPNAPKLYDDNGNVNWENNTFDNPLSELNATYRNESANLMANTTIGYKIIKGLEFKTNVGYNRSDLTELQLNPHTRFNPAWGLTSQSSSTVKNEGNRNSWIIEPQLDASYKLGDGRLNVIIGSTFQQQNEDRFAVLALGFANNSFMTNLSAANELQIINEASTQYRYIAFYGRINYNWKQKYIVNLTGRRDGSSRFGPGQQFANFGAVGAAWIFSKEEFLKNTSFLSFGKLRASFGTSGNDQIGDYQYLNNYTITDADYGGNIGLSPSRLFNPYYAWEENRKYEGALEVGLLKDRINLEIAYYTNRSKNQLIGVPLPGTTGFSSIHANLDATVENSGWEVNVRTENFRRKDFKWSTSFLLTLPKNKLISFEGLENSTYANQLVLGMPISVSRLYHLTGVNPQTGLFEFEDYNGDGIISSLDRQYNIDMTPKFYGSISNSFQYKNWNLDFMFQFVKKKGLNELSYTESPGMMLNTSTSVLDHWQNPGDHAFMQMYTTGWNYDAYAAYSRFGSSNAIISDASFIRLKSLSLSYRLPLDKEGQPKVTLFVQGQNLWTITKFKGGDPEQMIGFLPPMKRVMFGFRMEL